MGKNPAFQFYPSDWTRDLDDQDIEIEGAWIRICCRLWWSETPGEATRPIREWARILRKTEKKTIKIFQILFEKRIADGAILDNQNATIISRRMVRDYRISQIRKEVGSLGGNPKLLKKPQNLVNQTSNQNPTPSSSTSSSTSKKKKEYSEDFLAFYSYYPRRVDKDRAWKAWNSRNGSRPPLDVLTEAIDKQKKWRATAKPGDFRPEWKHPATWLNAGSWNDEIPDDDSTDPFEQFLKGVK